MKIICLGSGGYMPSESRHTSCYLIDTGHSIIILDAGTGMSRLGEHLHIINKYEEINIILSHYHLDHIIGIFYLFNWHFEKINFFGPGETLGFQSCKYVLSSIIGTPYCASIDALAKEVNFFDYNLKGFDLKNIKVGFTKQNHPGNSFGITFGNLFHYATDTILLHETFEKSESSNLLLHECWTINETAKGHGSLIEIIGMTKKYNIKRLGLIHINPNMTNEDLVSMNALIKPYSNIFIVEDNMTIDLS